MIISRAETIGAFNTGFETVKLQRPTNDSDGAAGRVGRGGGVDPAHGRPHVVEQARASGARVLARPVGGSGAVQVHLDVQALAGGSLRTSTRPISENDVHS